MRTRAIVGLSWLLGGLACDPAAEDVCAWTHGEAPMITAELALPPALVTRTVASPNAFYALSSADDSPEDVTLWKFSTNGERLWTARWGNAYGWKDIGLDLLASGRTVYMTGVAARYEAQEYWNAGHLFVRAYTHGGEVRWTWEDPSGPRLRWDEGRPKMLAMDGDELVVAATVHDGDWNAYLSVVRLSSQGEELQRWTHPAEGDVLAVHLDDSGDVWVATNRPDTWLGHWDAEGTFVESFQRDDAGARVAAFSEDGSLVAVGRNEASAVDELWVARFDPRSGDAKKVAVPVEQQGSWDRFLDVTVDCTGAAWVTTRGEAPMRVFDAEAREAWNASGLSTVAVGGDGVALTVGLDPASGMTLVRWLRP